MYNRVDVLWRSAELGSVELCRVREGPGDVSIESTTLLTYRDVPARIDYTVSLNSGWETQHVHVELSAGRRQQVVTLDHHDEGWVVDGNLTPELDPCVDVDLGWTPATNMIPLRRIAVDVGQSRNTTAAWVRFPELDVVVSEQRYTRLATDRVRYQSTTFEADLDVTPEGLVTSYGNGLWQATQLHRFR